MKLTYYKNGDIFLRRIDSNDWRKDLCSFSFPNLSRCPLHKIMGIFKCDNCILCSFGFLNMLEPKNLKTIEVYSERTMFLTKEEAV